MWKVIAVIISIVFAFQATLVEVDTLHSSGQYQYSSSDSIVTKIELGTGIVSLKTLEDWFTTRYLKRKLALEIARIKSVSDRFDAYKLKVVGEAPTALNKTYTFIHFIKTNALYLLPIELNKYYNTASDEMFGGFYNYREFDYYLIYRRTDSVLQMIFDSRKLYVNGLKVGYYKDDECVDYKPDRLKFSYDNNKQSIRFSGSVDYYCQEGKDRNSKQQGPFKSVNTNVIIRFKNGQWLVDKRSLYPNW
jgi:hypothetical protein